uniref:Uncharacterized protein LOC100373469 n=1 Tax=Saccoglossus kowalevskii TaxID=10224 RepID=A0ABM0GPN8_SACKO|nr:PREDICTED: uncharacterized protein LOC100373469 [Saccoglossus kowalevskii]
MADSENTKIKSKTKASKVTKRKSQEKDHVEAAEEAKPEETLKVENMEEELETIDKVNTSDSVAVNIDDNVSKSTTFSGGKTVHEDKDAGTTTVITTTSTTTYGYEERDFDNIDPKEYGIDIEDEPEYQYEPPKTDDLPDLYKLIDSLEKGDTELEVDREPPLLFAKPEHEPQYKKIKELTLEMEDEEIDAYVTDFDTDIKDQAVMIADVSLEEIQDHERRLRDEHISYQQQEMLVAKRRHEAIAMKEEKAKKRIITLLKEKKKELAKREELALQRERLQQDALHKTFRRSEHQLLRALEIRKGEVKTMYGDLTLADGQYGGSKGRRWKVDWTRTPQPIQIKLKCLRGVRDKLPGGRYVLMVSLYDRLGGHILRWSRLKGQQWGGATLPLTHDGKFYNIEMKLDQSVFTVCPSKPDVRPGMILMFELFLLRGSLLPVDKVVGWGVFPICDAQFNIIDGKYKVPFLRGEMDPRIEKHETIEKLIASDIDHWLCNLYIEVVKLQRYLAGQKEYEVELQFSSSILSFPDRIKGAEDPVDGELPVAGSRPDLNSLEGINSNGSKVSLGDTSNPSNDSAKKFPTGSDDSINKKAIKESDVSVSADGLRQRSAGSGVRPITVIGSRKIMEKTEKIESDNESEYDEEAAYLLKKQEDFIAVAGEQGVYYKKHMNNPIDVYTKKFKPFSTKGHLESRGHERLEYVSRQFLAELGFSQWRSREFWGMMIMLLLVWFLRMYIHYVGQWVFLNLIVIPINKFDFLPYTVSLNYQQSLLYTREEIAVVLIGPFTNIFILILLVCVSWLSQRVLGSYPGLGSKFTMAYGIMTFLDPIFILLIDAIIGTVVYTSGDDPIADASKLYYNFVRIQNNGLVGIFMTIFLYLFCMFTTVVIVYMYFLRLHNNGRMLDTFHRLHGLSEEFFVPYDLELSVHELTYIVKKAEQWRGEEGERQKTAVYDYVWEEESVEEVVWDANGEHRQVKQGRREITSHVSIHKIHLDGLRELFRHFLRLPDGAIVEVFGEMGITGMDKDMKKALTKGAQGVENLMGSQYSLSKLRNRRRKTAGGLGSTELRAALGETSGLDEDDVDEKKPSA